MGANPDPGGKVRILYDTQTNTYVEFPAGTFELVVGREAYNGLPVPLLPDRRRGDSFHLKENLRDRVGKIMAAVINTISRHHAILYVREDSIAVRDAGSREGTKVNGASLKGSDKHTLRNKDEIQVSAWSLVYYDEPRDIGEVLKKGPGIYRIDDSKLER